jgi:pilus assembly protein CpaB
MSRNAAAMSPGRANRRFVLLAITLGLIGAVLVYVAFSRSSTDSGGSKAGGQEVAVVVAKQEIPARTKITQAMLDVRLIAPESRSEFAYGDPVEVVGQVTRFPIAANEQVLSSKVVNLAPGATAASRALSLVIPQGKRGFAIAASSIQNAGGLVLPGDYVDIVIIYDVAFGGDEQGSYLVQTLMQNIEVLAVAQGVVDIVPEATPTAGGQRVRNSEGHPDPGASTVTLALTPEQLQKIYLAEANGRIRLSLRPYGEGGERPVEFIVKNELYPPNLPRPVTR